MTTVSQKTNLSPVSDSAAKKALRATRVQFVPLVIGALVMLGTALYLITHPSIHPDIMFDDMMSFVDFKSYTIPPYLSIFSFLGFIFWFFGSAFCFLGILIIRRYRENPTPRSVYFMAALMGMGLVMGLDDMLRLHENLIPYYTGLSENITLGAYGLYFVLLIVVFRKEITTHNMLFLVLFYLLFGFSEVVDVLSPEAMQLQGNPLLAALEEMPKFVGLIAFASYCLYYSYYEVMKRIDSNAST